MLPRERTVEIPQQGMRLRQAAGPHLQDHDYGNSVRPQARLQVPFGLEISDFPHIQLLLEAEPQLVHEANIMMRSNLAARTIKIYESIIRDFKAMCVREALEFPNFSEQTVIRFLAISHKNNPPFSFYRRVVPALRSLKGVLGFKTSALTERVKIAKNSLMCVITTKRKPVRKAHAFSVDILNELIEKIVIPLTAEPWKINPNDFRGIVRCVVYLRRSFENLLQKIEKGSVSQRIALSDCGSGLEYLPGETDPSLL